MPKQIRYKWMLREGSSKDVCPKCGHKTFVPYVLSADGKTIAKRPNGEAFGRCERINSCAYCEYPNNMPGEYKAPEPKKEKPKAKTRFEFRPEVAKVNYSVLTAYARVLFTNYLRASLYSLDPVARAEAIVIGIWQDYRIGATNRGRTIFWQIDHHGTIRDGKTIQYKPDGHRDKDAYPCVNWCHVEREFAGQYAGEELVQCFFGQHLLQAQPDKEIIIVESEKTAAIMSGYAPQYLWLACGGAQDLNDENPKYKHRFECLRGRHVILFPDNKQYFLWERTAYKHGFSITTYFEDHPIEEGCDILDYYDAGIYILDDALKATQQK